MSKQNERFRCLQKNPVVPTNLETKLQIKEIMWYKQKNNIIVVSLY